MSRLIYGIVNEKAGYGYVNVAKAACTSIKLAIAEHLGQAFERVQWRRPWRVDAAFIQARRDIRWFTFVRNPFARLVSAWADFIGGDWISPRRERDLRLNTDLLPCRGMTFEAFVRESLRPRMMRTNPHFATQTSLIHIAGRTGFLVDELYKVEELPDAWDLVQERTGLGPLSHARQSRHEPWQTCYTPELREIVEERYKADLAAFQYTFGEATCESA